MKKQIICTRCKSKLMELFPTDTPYPGEHVKFIAGKARREFMCDDCGCPINTTDDCFAFSIWADYGGIPYHEWESGFLSLS